MGRPRVLGLLALMFVIGSMPHLRGPLTMLAALLEPPAPVVEPAVSAAAAGDKAGNVGPPA